MFGIEIGRTAETEIDRHEHQSGAVRDRHGKRPEPKLRRLESAPAREDGAD